ncbi:restriction endonuclease subunit S [Vibrio campbellii]|uniref:restriction endonuclease subunit S n=1 Tax=Vibrio campbellii TaxID=680 RepID=UPI00249B4AC2|nr:restriction endonuclease subunit S [Vibrio campbellii]
MVPNCFQHVVGLGNFPSDWLVTSADEITEKITKGTTPPKSEIVDDKKIPFLRVNNLGFTGSLNSNTEMLFVTEDAHKGFLSRSIAYPNDILMNIVGPPLGKIAILDDEYPEYNMNQAVLIYRCKEQLIDKGYFLSFLGSELAQQWLQSRSKKTSGQQNLTIQLCKELPTPVPPLPEQRKIAQILSTWDRGIATTEKLIDASNQQKKALMQQLLTGKKRLIDPETGRAFEGEWENTHLSNIASIKKGKALSAKNLVAGSYPVIAGGKSSPYSHVDFTHENVITVSASGAYAGYVSYHPYKIWASDCSVVTAKPANYLGFIFQWLQLNQIRIYSMQSGGAQPHIYPKDLEVMKLRVPKIEEQQKIASVLTAADKEIEVMETKLAQLNQEKKALMQQLLTGKRRVKVDEEVAA